MTEELENAILESSEPKFDPKEVEKKLIEEARNRADDPTETAAMVYTMHRPEFLKRSGKLSARGRTRVLEALVQYPLNGNVDFPNVLERECYMFAESMIQSKFVMMMNQYKESSEELMRAQDEFVFNKEEVERLQKEGE